MAGMMASKLKPLLAGFIRWKGDELQNVAPCRILPALALQDFGCLRPRSRKISRRLDEAVEAPFVAAVVLGRKFSSWSKPG
jgi:hypothetical protein